MEEAYFPTMQMESLISLLLMDVKEGWENTNADVVRAYRLTEMQDYTLINLVRESGSIMYDVSSKYERHVKLENNKLAFYLKVKKAI